MLAALVHQLIDGSMIDHSLPTCEVSDHFVNPKVKVCFNLEVHLFFQQASWEDDDDEKKEGDENKGKLKTQIHVGQYTGCPQNDSTLSHNFQLN